jgi:hypothetical protein
MGTMLKTIQINRGKFLFFNHLFNRRKPFLEKGLFRKDYLLNTSLKYKNIRYYSRAGTNNAFIQIDQLVNLNIKFFLEKLF